MANNVDPAIQQLIQTAQTTDDPLAFLIHNIVERYSPIDLAVIHRRPALNPIIKAAFDRLVELDRGDQIMDYLLAKNIKIHGGINEYIAHFFNVGIDHIDDILSLPESDDRDMLIYSARTQLEKMLLQPAITAENRARVQAAINLLNPPHPGAAAPAAGGARRRRRRRQTRRRRSNRY
jgi:hypothetical protein